MDGDGNNGDGNGRKTRYPIKGKHPPPPRRCDRLCPNRTVNSEQSPRRPDIKPRRWRWQRHCWHYSGPNHALSIKGLPFCSQSYGFWGVEKILTVMTGTKYASAVEHQSALSSRTPCRRTSILMIGAKYGFNIGPRPSVPGNRRTEGQDSPLPSFSVLKPMSQNPTKLHQQVPEVIWEGHG